jgi:uncharacterized Fe-S center protein
MTKVYFSQNIQKIIETIDFSKLGKKVAIKVHFGERGCTTFIDPQIVKEVYKKIESLGKKATLIECNVLYKGSRTNRTDHLKTAKEHGFGDMEMDILDGENGEEFVEVQGCKIGKGIKKYDSLIVLSHFKGHATAGFGGALKNVGMGLGSRAGKLDMHSAVLPKISEDCIGCGICAENCNAEAIRLENGKAQIDDEKCEGCAMCIAVCNKGAVTIPWSGRTNEELQKRIAEYTAAVLSLFPQAIFINILQNITENCDCRGVEQKPIMSDVGILYSNDITAIDKASLNLANKFSENKFGKINGVDKDKQLEMAEKLGLGSSQYELVEMD